MPAGEATRCACAPRVGPLRLGCHEEVAGIDAQRCCDACIAAGAPVRVSWAELKATLPPERVHTTGEQIVGLANAWMVEANAAAPKPPASAPKPRRPRTRTHEAEAVDK